MKPDKAVRPWKDSPIPLPRAYFRPEKSTFDFFIWNYSIGTNRNSAKRHCFGYTDGVIEDLRGNEKTFMKNTCACKKRNAAWLCSFGPPLEETSDDSFLAVSRSIFARRIFWWSLFFLEARVSCLKQPRIQHVPRWTRLNPAPNIQTCRCLKKDTPFRVRWAHTFLWNFSSFINPRRASILNFTNHLPTELFRNLSKSPQLPSEFSSLSQLGSSGARYSNQTTLLFLFPFFIFSADAFERELRKDQSCLAERTGNRKRDANQTTAS